MIVIVIPMRVGLPGVVVECALGHVWTYLSKDWKGISHRYTQINTDKFKPEVQDHFSHGNTRKLTETTQEAKQ
jgi:hypothetical protein